MCAGLVAILFPPFWLMVMPGSMRRWCSALVEERLHCYADVLGDLAEERGVISPTLVSRDRGAAALGIAELLVGAALTDCFKTRSPEDVSQPSQRVREPAQNPRSGRYRDLLEPNKIAVQSGFAVLQKHGNDLLQVRLQLIQALALAVGAREAWDVAHQQPSLRAALNHC